MTVIFDNGTVHVRKYGDGVIGVFDERTGIRVFVGGETPNVLVRTMDDNQILDAVEGVDRVGSFVRVTNHYDPQEVPFFCCGDTK